jgi:hypothetical protein
MVHCRTVALLAAALTCSMTGCLAIYSTRPVEVTAINAETGQPVANLPINVRYSSMLGNLPTNASSITDATGRAVLPIADFQNGPISICGGGYESLLSPEMVRNGGMVVTGQRNPDSTITPKVNLQLVPQPSSFFLRLFGWVP